MAEIIIYIIKWSVLLTLLYSCFGLFLRRETFHAFNRAVLLLIVVFSMVLPLCTYTSDVSPMLQQSIGKAEGYVYAIMEQENTTAIVDEGSALSLSWQDVVLLVYIAGFVCFWLLYTISLMSLIVMIVRGKRIAIDGISEKVHVVKCYGVTIPCSWMRWVLIGECHTEEKHHSALAHEVAHVELWHSWDMLLCEITARTLWFLPFAWMLRNDMRDLHEYQADRRVLANGYDENEYQMLLINHATCPSRQLVANSFNQSDIKKRFMMMCRHQSGRCAMLKAFYLLPLLAFTIVAFAKPTIVANIDTIVKSEVNKSQLLPKIVVSKTNADEMTEDWGLPEPQQLVAERVKPEPLSVDEQLEIEARSLPEVIDSIKMLVADTTGMAKLAEEQLPVLQTIRTAPISLNEYYEMEHKFYVEQYPDYTKLIWYMWTGGNKVTIKIDGDRVYLRDMDTDDRYMCRSIEGYENKQVAFTLLHHRDAVLQFEMIFPPLDKSVKEIALMGVDSSCSPVKLKGVLRKPVKVIR